MFIYMLYEPHRPLSIFLCFISCKHKKWIQGVKKGCRRQCEITCGQPELLLCILMSSLWMTTAFGLSFFLLFFIWSLEIKKNVGVYLACHFTKSINFTFSAKVLIFFAPGSVAVPALLAAGNTQLGRRNCLSRKHAIVSRSSDETSDVSFLLLNCSCICSMTFNQFS